MFLDERMQLDLQERGYTTTRLLDRGEASAILDEIKALSPSDAFAPDGKGRYPATYHCTFLDPDQTYKRAVDTLNRKAFESRVCALLDDYRMLTSNLYVKAPGAGQFEVHQNWPVTDDIRDTTLTLWCPFTDVGPHNGTISVVPGSHKLVPDVFTVTASKYFSEFYDELLERWLEPISLEAGECLIFDDSLLHWSDSNDSDEYRWSAQLVFYPAEKTPLIYFYDAEHAPPRYEMYEVTPTFFIEHEMADVARRPDDLALHGLLERQNTSLSGEQFADLMAHGPEIRRLVYSGAPIEVAFAAALDLAPPGGDPAAAAAQPAHSAPAPGTTPVRGAAAPVAPEPVPSPDPSPGDHRPTRRPTRRVLSGMRRRLGAGVRRAS